MIKLLIFDDGNKYWFLNMKLHRANGLAVISDRFNCQWWWYGQEVTEYEHMMLSHQEKLND